MRMLDAEKQIKELAPLIDTALLSAKLKEYSRFGLPGSSSTDGRGGEPPLPLLGRTDRSVLRDRNLAEESATDAVVALQRLYRIQLAWCKPYEGDPDEDSRKELAGKPCSNVFCHRVCSGKKDDKLRNGRCPTCAEYYRNTGKERTAELCDVTNANLAPVPAQQRAV